MNKKNFQIDEGIGLLGIIFFLMFLYLIISSFIEYRTNVIAMENGYVQKIVGNKKIWVKENKNCSKTIKQNK